MLVGSHLLSNKPQDDRILFEGFAKMGHYGCKVVQGGPMTARDSSRRLEDVSRLLQDSLKNNLKPYAKSLFLLLDCSFVTMGFTMAQDTCKMAQHGSKMPSADRKLAYIGAVIALYGLFLSQGCHIF